MNAAKTPRSLVRPDCAGERHQGFRAVGPAVAALAAPILVKRGGGVLVRLKANWSAIVGPEWAAVTWPVAIGREGVLKVRTVPTAALELQHRAPLLIERINFYLGRAAVNRLVIVQAILQLASKTGNGVPRSFGNDEMEALDARFSGIDDPELRAALGRLGRALGVACD